MRISKKWLNEYIPVNDLSDSEIDGLLSLSGTEIEETLYPWEGLKGVILGTVIETRPHPSHSRLIVCIIQLPGETKRLVTADKTVKTVFYHQWYIQQGKNAQKTEKFFGCFVGYIFDVPVLNNLTLF